MLYLGADYQERAKLLVDLCDGMVLREADPQTVSFVQYEPDLETVRIACNALVELEPEWRYEEDARGGCLVLGPSIFPLCRVWHESQYKALAPWRWALLCNVAEQEHGGATDVLRAVREARIALLNLETRRAVRCPGCGQPIRPSVSCHRDVVLIPAVVLASPCLRSRGHEGQHLPICEACYLEAGERWISGVASAPMALKKATPKVSR